MLAQTSPPIIAKTSSTSTARVPAMFHRLETRRLRRKAVVPRIRAPTKENRAKYAVKNTT